ncbi:DNA-directed RNA polymerase III complex subunit Rpc25 [Knufia peltigerae]|uniref:DNA-directed RNA polymerase subunit n=1 Tax=Knufia peltigerae TaxID=1002370 RepID=A0AA39CV75_9EURO|nr:DNA-directed RNA polymerase III complex subunit Rpc25 [Knufia peltigerae]
MGTANDAPGITSLSQLAGDLRDVLKALSIEKIDVMGVSFNGGIIQLFALAYPELVGSAAFVATTATGSPLMADRAALAEKNGLESLVEPTRSRGFSQTTKFDDLVQIPPHGFTTNLITSKDLEDRINEKFSNKVVQKVGLCICMYDLLKASDGLIGTGTGNANVNVTFRMIVFRPFKGEIITGTVQKCTPTGIRITTQFFDDIFVPQTMLFEGCQFDEAEKTWVWRTEESELWFDEGTVVNLRIEAEKWHDQAPKGPNEVEKEGERKVPYAIEVDQHLNPDDLLDAINEQLYAKDITTPTAYHSTETSQSKSQLPWTQKRSREKLAKEPDLADFDKAAYKRQMAMPHPGCIRGRYSELWSTKSRIPLASLQNGLSSSGTTNAPRVI